MTKIKWKRSSDGYCDSHCGHWRITPRYCGRTKPQFFDLLRDLKEVAMMLPSQGACKEEALRILEKEEREVRLSQPKGKRVTRQNT